MLCTHSKDGCEWTGELGELEHHLSEVNHSGESLYIDLKVDSCGWGHFVHSYATERDELTGCHKLDAAM